MQKKYIIRVIFLKGSWERVYEVMEANQFNTVVELPLIEL